MKNVLCSLFTRQQRRTKLRMWYTAQTPQEVELEQQEEESQIQKLKLKLKT